MALSAGSGGAPVEAIRPTAESVCGQLELLSQCETDHETVLRWLQELLEQLMLAQQLTLDFDCATRHDAEARTLRGPEGT
jgi:ferredoxin-NADP reductase